MTLSSRIALDIKSGSYFPILIKLLILTFVVTAIRWTVKQVISEKDLNTYLGVNYYVEIFSWMLMLLLFVIGDFYNF